MTEAATPLPVKTEKKSADLAARPLDNLRREVDRLFEDFTRGYWHLPFTGGRVFDVAPYWRGDVAFGATPAVDVVEEDDAYTVSAELPGIDPKNIEVKFAEDTLVVKGEKKEEREEKKKDYYLSERRYGSFERSFRVPDGVDADKIAANFKNGVLTVTLPKNADAKRKQKTIPVKVAA